jgi:O-antigen/teichoic acid export membrane protein
MARLSLTRSIGTLLTGQTVRLVLGAGSAMIIAALAGPSVKGALALLVGISAILSTVLSLGMNGVTTYFVGSRRWTAGEAVCVLAASVGWSTASALLLGLLVSALRVEQIRELGPTVLALACGAVTLNSVTGALLLGLERFHDYAVTTLIVPVITVVAYFAIRFFGGSTLDAAILSWIVGLVLACTPGLIPVMRLDGFKVRWPREFASAVSYGLKSSMATAMNVLNLRLDVVLLGLLAGTTVTGYYSLGTQFTEFLWIVPTAIGYVVLPRIAANQGDDGMQTARLCRNALALGTVLAAAPIGASVAYAYVVPRYWPSVQAVLLLLPGTIAFTVAKVVGNDLYGRGLPQAHVWAALCSVAITLAGDIMLIPRYGFQAAAMVSSIAYSLYAAIILRRFLRETHLRLRTALVVDRNDVRDMWAAARTTLGHGFRVREWTHAATRGDD